MKGKVGEGEIERGEAVVIARVKTKGLRRRQVAMMQARICFKERGRRGREGLGGHQGGVRGGQGGRERKMTLKGIKGEGGKVER